jgi:putative SOS response-associated peptidase YedK
LGNGKKVPYYTKRKDGQLMLFAGLYDTAYLKDHDGPLHSTTIVTTDSSSFFAFLHDRMPVILEKDQAETWLDPSSSWSTSLVKLMKPYKGELDW